MSMSHSKTLRYRVVDVFTSQPLEGNALAVIPDANGLTDAQMLRIAREFNLSETTFVTPPADPQCAARVRIFTPHAELPFAGHPTIGTAWVLRDEARLPSGKTEFCLEEGVGAVPVRVDSTEENRLWLRTPKILDGPCIDAKRCAAALGLTSEELLPVAPQILSAGNPTLYVPVRSPDIVDRAWLDRSAALTLAEGVSEAFCVFVFAATQYGAFSRMFAPHLGVAEDPATGSSTGPLAAYMMRHALVSRAHGTRFLSIQGEKMGRRSELHVEIAGDSGSTGIDVGGNVVPVARGELTL